MAIQDFVSSKRRQRVALFGQSVESSPEVERVFKERGYEVKEYTEQELRDPASLIATDSIIFFQREEKPTAVCGVLEQFAEGLLNYDCRIIVRIASGERLKDRARTIVLNTLRGLALPATGLSPGEREALPPYLREREGVALPPYVYICDQSFAWPDIAKVIHEHPAGDPPNLDLKINVAPNDGKEFPLSDVQILLLQRAFHDSSSVNLKVLTQGLSGAVSFRGHHKLTSPILKPWPQPCFVKLGTRRAIEKEYGTHESAAVFLPFHLAPRLDLKRSGLGARDGILVSDFVDESETLSSCACQGRAAAAIPNLFNRTLRAWNNTSTVVVDRSLSGSLQILLPSGVPPHRKQRISDLGGTLSPEEMRDMFAKIGSSRVRVGWIHGDLHATNVLVRGSDALLIDFEKASSDMPLVYDPASLQAGLLVEGFAADRREVADIIASIKSLYDLSVIIDWIQPCEPHDESSWFFECVRQIRTHAQPLECERGQYATALALSLFKKACNPHEFEGKRQDLRAGAYALAENLMKSLAKIQ